MLFSSITFLYIFLPIVLAIYFILPRKLKNVWLMVSSFIFYAWGEPKYVILMAITTIVAFFLGKYTYAMKQSNRPEKAKLAVVGTVVFNIGLLAFFKYADFLIGNLNTLFGLSIPLLNLPLPLGISFYSFQTMSYTIDVYRGEAKPQKNPLDLATYVALFPQLIAGPIVRYQTVAKQLTNRKETVGSFGDGVVRFVTGLGKKVLIANQAGAVFTSLGALSVNENSVALSWLSSLAFTLQIYFDFSGYSDMAIGLGKMLGFEFLENFNYPYISKSITEFWRRWHISLSSWFRDYVYIPLGGSRKGKTRTLVNILVVWLLTGFWHGASWNFVIWGLFFFVFLMIEKLGFLKALERMPKAIAHIYTLFVVNISWVIFSYDKLDVLGTNLGNMFGLNGLPLWNERTTYYICSYGILFIVFMIAATPIPKLIWEKGKEKFTQKKALLGGVECVVEPALLVLLMVLCTMSLASDSFNPFLYFRF